jgi:hypothetical protein
MSMPRCLAVQSRYRRRGYLHLVSADEDDVLVWPIGSDTREVKSSGDALTSRYGTSTHWGDLLVNFLVSYPD